MIRFLLIEINSVSGTLTEENLPDLKSFFDITGKKTNGHFFQNSLGEEWAPENLPTYCFNRSKLPFQSISRAEKKHCWLWAFLYLLFSHKDSKDVIYLRVSGPCSNAQSGQWYRSMSEAWCSSIPTQLKKRQFNDYFRAKEQLAAQEQRYRPSVIPFFARIALDHKLSRVVRLSTYTIQRVRHVVSLWHDMTSWSEWPRLCSKTS